MHYGFPARLHSDKWANFESKAIQKLCNIAGIQKSQTSPFHPMGNGMVERFNQTLLNMLGTMSEKQKSDWKSYVPILTHAYNAAMHESTGFSPFFLMFGLHPRLAIDDFLGIRSSEERKSHQDYADKLKNRLSDSYKCASEDAAHEGEKYKHYYNKGIRHSVLEAGDRVLVKKIGIKGKHKLEDIWESTPYVVISQPMPDIPLYMVKKENSTRKSKPLHRNMLLPFNALPNSLEKEPSKPKKPVQVVQEKPTLTHQLTVLWIKMKNRQGHSLPSPDASFPKRGLHHVKHHQENKLLLGDHQLPHLVGQQHGKRNYHQQGLGLERAEETEEHHSGCTLGSGRLA